MKNEKKQLEKKYNPELTKTDLQSLGETKDGRRTDRKSDDVILEDRERKVDFTGKELDVPGRSVSKPKRTNLTDEENELFSQGSAHNGHLEKTNSLEKK